MSGYWAKTATDIDFVKRLAIFMSESARLQEADIPFDAAHSHFQTMFSEVLKAGLHSRGMKHFNSLQHVCDSWEQASHLTVGQGENMWHLH